MADEVRPGKPQRQSEKEKASLIRWLFLFLIGVVV